MIILDSDILIDLLRQYTPAVTWLDSLGEEEILLPGFVVMELLQGCINKVSPTQRYNMKQPIDLHTLLSQVTDKDQQIVSFLLLSLGIIESLISGAITVSGAVNLFFYADNCLFVRKNLRHQTADEIMSRGVQLPDLFKALSPEEAQQEFQGELSTMRLLCLKLLENKRLAA